MGIDDLAPTAAAITADLERRDLPAFPSFPVVDGDGRGLGLAIWPDNDWSSFLDLAQRVGAVLVYLRVDRFSEEELEPFSEAVDDADAEHGAELRAAVSDAHRHVGKVFGVRAAFVRDGVLHDWTQVTDWYSRLLDLDAKLGAAPTGGWPRRFERTPNPDEQLVIDNTDAWAVKISEDQRFITAVNEAARREVAGEILPELGRFLTADGTSTGQRMVSIALEPLRRAEQRLRSEVKPRIEADLEERLDELAAEVAARGDFGQARTKEERRRPVATCITEAAGYRIRRLVEPLLRRADVVNDVKAI